MRFIARTIRNVMVCLMFISAIQFFLKWKSYNVSVKEFKTIAANSIGKFSFAFLITKFVMYNILDSNANVAISNLTLGLRNKYMHLMPRHPEWIPISAGGLHLRAQLLYADLTEYIAVFAAGGRTIGRSGIFLTF